MTVRIPMPPGCRGFQMEDGTSYRDKEGGTVTVEDHHAAAVRRQVGGDGGLTGYGAFRMYGGTRDGRWCPECRFLANKWSTECPRCAARGVTTLTIPEADMPARPPSRMPSECLVPTVPRI